MELWATPKQQRLWDFQLIRMASGEKKSKQFPRASSPSLYLTQGSTTIKHPQTMKIKTIARSTADYQRERVSGVERLQKNKDPRLHPFEQAREYTRAVRAVKLDKMFAKPFVAAMDDHSDAVWCTATSPTRVTQFVSGSCDGEIRIWDLALKRTVWASYVFRFFVFVVLVFVSTINLPYTSRCVHVYSFFFFFLILSCACCSLPIHHVYILSILHIHITVSSPGLFFSFFSFFFSNTVTRILVSSED